MNKLKGFALASLLSAAPMANADVFTTEQLADLFAQSSTAASLVEQFATVSFAENIEVFLTAVFENRPDQLLEVVTQLFTQYQTAEQVSAITDVARNLGLENQAITVAAIEAGIDPTVIAEATAAGVEAAADPVPNAPSDKAPVSAN